MTKHSTLRGVAAACALYALTLATSHASDTDKDAGLRWRASTELGALHNSARADAPLNPGGNLFKPERDTVSAAVNLKLQAQPGGLRLVADTWWEAQHDMLRRLPHDERAQVQVPEALADYSLSDTVSVAAGLNIARWGTGYSWNPANPVADSDANNTSRPRTYRRDGDPFARAEWQLDKDTLGVYLTRFRQNDPLLNPLRQREWALYGRYQHVLDGGDITGFVSAGRQGERFLGAAASMTVGEQLALQAEVGVRNRRRSPLPLLDALTLGPTTVLTLPSWDATARKSWTPSALVGGQYTWPNRTNLIVEYLYNGNGLDKTEFQRLQDGIGGANVLLGAPGLPPGLDAAGKGFLLEGARLVGRLRQHYLFLRVAREELFRDLDLHYYLRVGLEDGAQVHGAYLRYALGQRARAQLGAELYRGPARSESRLIPVRNRVEATLSIDL